MHQIFINYRIADSGDLVGRLQEGLSREFGSDVVFWDKVGLEGGDAWPERLRRQAEGCKVMLVVIGRSWQSTLYDPTHELSHLHRLHGDNDWVKLEIQAAFRAGRKVIPVLAVGAKVPPKRWLRPFGLEALAGQHGMHLRTGADYDADLSRLIERLEACGVAPSVRRSVSSTPSPARSSRSLPPPPPIGSSLPGRPQLLRALGRCLVHRWLPLAAVLGLGLVAVAVWGIAARPSAAPSTEAAADTSTLPRQTRLPATDPGAVARATPSANRDPQTPDAAVASSPPEPAAEPSARQREPSAKAHGAASRTGQAKTAKSAVRRPKGGSPRGETATSAPVAGESTASDKKAGARPAFQAHGRFADDEGQPPEVFGDPAGFADDEGRAPQVFGDDAPVFADDEGHPPAVFGDSTGDLADGEGHPPQLLGEPVAGAEQ